MASTDEQPDPNFGFHDRILETGELPALPDDPSRPIPRRRPVRFTLKLVAFTGVVYFFVLPLIPGFRRAWDELIEVQPTLLAVGLALQIAALFCYSLLTKAALGDSGEHLSYMRMFRIQMSTKALSHLVPGGSAAGSALGYRLLTLSGVHGPDAGFALATAGLGSAVVLNLILWCGLIVSIPIRGVNALYGIAAVAGIVIMGVAAAVVFGLMEGQGRSERFVRWIATKVRVNEDRAANVLHHLADRLEDLIADRALLRRVAFWATLNWLLDAASLWVFIRAFGPSVGVDGLIVAFGLANVLAVIPITPGGLGIVEWIYIPTLVGFGVPRAAATLGVASYRIAQFFFPILLGGLLYLSLRVGPWKIERRERLRSLRELAEDDSMTESRIDFALRFGRRRPDGDPDGDPDVGGGSSGDATMQ
jgi:putative heme transporter